VLVSVEDTGTGIDPKDIGRVFDSFFTTKEQGMGMGLSICRSIIEAHGGRLWASASVDRGAVFNIQMPVPAQELQSDWTAMQSSFLQLIEYRLPRCGSPLLAQAV
jgi:signal transduction histidine kinase